MGAAFVPATSIAVAGVPAHDTGVAGGLINTTPQIGGALGLAALATLANSRSQAAMPGQDTLSALDTGYTAGFVAAAAVAVVAALVAAVSVGGRR